MLSGEQFRERIAKWDQEGTPTFLLPEVTGLRPSDFPPGSMIRILNNVLTPGGVAVEFPHHWQVQEDKFTVDVAHAVAAKSPWPHAMSPEVMCDFLRVIIERRAELNRDCRLIDYAVAPRSDIAFNCRYAIMPQEPELNLAYSHAVYALGEIRRALNGAQNIRQVAITLAGRVQKPRDRQIFEWAEAFRNAAYVLYRQARNDQNDAETLRILMVPCTVNTCFAIELYIKCLIWIEQNKRIKSHNLEELFDNLTEPTRDKVIKYYDAIQAINPQAHLIRARMGQNATEFRHSLAQSAKAYETLRYGYETPVEEQVFSIGHIQTALKQVILELRPDWTVLVSREPIVVNPHTEFIRST